MRTLFFKLKIEFAWGLKTSCACRLGIVSCCCRWNYTPM